MFKFKKLIITLAIILTFSASVLAQENTNILPLHTGKSYVLDFPVKVTRVVGGDPSAMELNLFKKDENNPDSNGYQLLVAPISERTTNIIVWTEAGLYVFDVIIDNSSPFTADTIINVPDAKKFTIPLVNTTGSNIPIVKTQSKPTQDVQVLDEGVNNENETFNAAAPVYTDPDIATSEDIKNHEEYSHIENNSQEYISSNNETQNANSNEKLPEL
ncbi:MAG: pilus assembly protein N-terminal domain-containing protein, partial [Cyanobacteriota bacterium]